MLTPAGHLTYCTNIHAGESWPDHFEALKKYFPGIKKKFSPDKPMGIGLRLSNEASLDLIHDDQLTIFKDWLGANDAYVFTMNGFPYGGFHHVRVKDQVHSPDWTTEARVDYSLRLFRILDQLLPEGMDGGVSTSPMSYRHWFRSPEELKNARQKATDNILRVVAELARMHKISGKSLHLDIEPEPDGLMETGAEFIEWYENELIPAGHAQLPEKISVSGHEVTKLLKAHIQLCYDVCHFAIGFEPHAQVIRQIKEKGIRVGKIQISAALSASLPGEAAERKAIKDAFAVYNEPVYLHQVVARKENGSLLRYPDLTEALEDEDRTEVKEWRAHFHVPVFAEDFGILQSTQQHIREVLYLQKADPFTQHLEIETYTWEVLPASLKLPLDESIIRELRWVNSMLQKNNAK
ncbi:MAG: metabolite traffic protein EboE [Bacteroidota bacterium]|nr:metabolite traffic protein EboE [Bacteroidota bacterium]